MNFIAAALSLAIVGGSQDPNVARLAAVVFLLNLVQWVRTI